MTLDEALSVIGPGGPYLQDCLKELPNGETERFLIGAALCKQASLLIPSHASRRIENPDFWLTYYASQPMSFGVWDDSFPEVQRSLHGFTTLPSPEELAKPFVDVFDPQPYEEASSTAA